MPRRGMGRLVALTAVVLWVGFATGCRSTTGEAPLGADGLAEAEAALGKPMSGDMAALYHLRIPSSQGLRLSIVQLGRAGRLTVSEPFGSMVSLVAWEDGGETRLFDLRQGCRIQGGDLSSVLGVVALPLPQTARLLGGRLPATGGDRVSPTDDGRIEIIGADWSAAVTVVGDPWRIVNVEGPTGAGDGAWRLRLKQHSGSVPGWLRVDSADGRWAEMELIGLEWDTLNELPPLPSLPECGGTAE